MTDPANSRPPIRLVISDIDGTIVTHDKVLTPGAIEAVRKLKEAGIRFTLTSSRPPRGMKKQMDALNVTEPVAAFNGGMIVQPDFTVLKKRLVPRDAATKVIQIISDSGLSVWLFTDRDWFIRDPNGTHVEREQYTVNFSATLVPNFDSVLDRAGKIVGVSDDFDAVIRCEKRIHAECGESVAASRSQPYYLDVTHPDANKGQAVLDLSEILNIPTEQIATIGDMPADVFMFKKSGISIAMGNASPEVKAAATFVTDTNDQEGFAKAIEKFILRQAAIAEVR